MKKLTTIVSASLLALTLLAGCGGGETPPVSSAPAASGNSTPASSAVASLSGPISVISREPGSGTRGAFIELLGIEEKGADGSKTDRTTPDAMIANQTNVVMTNVSGDEYAIGYISLGSLNETVKALAVDGADATAENVKNGSYKVARPFNIATKGEPQGLAKDFISFIQSAEGQQVVEDSGYIKTDDAATSFVGEKPEGKLVIAGSSSVAPVMEKLIEAYADANPAAAIELQVSDSTAGMTAVTEGTCDIGMASRAMKDSEKEVLTGVAIANDGIAVVVAPENPTTGLTSEQLRQIFTGEVTDWADVQ